MKTRKEFSFNGIAMLINGKIATKGTKFTIRYARKSIDVEITSIRYRMKGGRKSVMMIVIDENAKEYVLKYTLSHGGTI